MAVAAQEGPPASIPHADSDEGAQLENSGFRWLGAALLMIMLGAQLAWFGLLYKLAELLL